MNHKALGFMSLLAAPMLAHAQFTTLEYQGNVMDGGDRLMGSITFNDSGVTSFQFGASDGTQLGEGPFPSIAFTSANGAITGAVVDWGISAIGGSYVAELAFSIGPHGDTYSNFIGGGPNGECVPICGVMEFNSTPGAWEVVRAPEIDPASAASGLTLLLGGIAVLRARRNRTY